MNDERNEECTYTKGQETKKVEQRTKQINDLPSGQNVVDVLVLHQPCRIDSSHMISSWTIPFLILDPILGVVLFLDGCRTVVVVLA